MQLAIKGEMKMKNEQIEIEISLTDNCIRTFLDKIFSLNWSTWFTNTHTILQVTVICLPKYIYSLCFLSYVQTVWLFSIQGPNFFCNEIACCV